MSSSSPEHSFFETLTDLHRVYLGEASPHPAQDAPVPDAYVHTNLGLGRVKETGEGRRLHLEWPLVKTVEWSEVAWWEGLEAFMERTRSMVDTLDAQPFSYQNQCALMWATQALRYAARRLTGSLRSPAASGGTSAGSPGGTQRSPRWLLHQRVP